MITYKHTIPTSKSAWFSVYCDIISFMRLDWKVHVLMSYLLLITYSPMGSKCCNTSGSSERSAKGSILKIKPHFVTFHESIGQSINFSANFAYIYIYIYILVHTKKLTKIISREMYIYIYIYIRGSINKFPDFFFSYGHFYW